MTQSLVTCRTSVLLLYCDSVEYKLQSHSIEGKSGHVMCLCGSSFLSSQASYSLSSQVCLCCCVTLTSIMCLRPCPLTFSYCHEHVLHVNVDPSPHLQAFEWADINRRSDALCALPVGYYVDAQETDCRERWLVGKTWLSYCGSYGSCIRNCSREKYRKYLCNRSTYGWHDKS